MNEIIFSYLSVKRLWELVKEVFYVDLKIMVIILINFLGLLIIMFYELNYIFCYVFFFSY